MRFYGRTYGDNRADINLHHDGGTETQSVASIYRNADLWHVVHFTNTVEISASSTFRLAIEGTHASNTFELFGIEAQAAAWLDQTLFGSDCHRTERTNSGSWTDTTTKQSLIYPIIASFDDGAGGGSGGSAQLVDGGLVA